MRAENHLTAHQHGMETTEFRFEVGGIVRWRTSSPSSPLTWQTISLFGLWNPELDKCSPWCPFRRRRSERWFRVELSPSASTASLPITEPARRIYSHSAGLRFQMEQGDGCPSTCLAVSKMLLLLAVFILLTGPTLVFPHRSDK